MLNFKFDAAWLLLPANIYHEIRKKMMNEKNCLEHKMCYRSEMIWILCWNCSHLFFPLTLTHHVENWFDNDSHQRTKVSKMRTLIVTPKKILRTLWFDCNFPRRIHWFIITCPAHTSTLSERSCFPFLAFITPNWSIHKIPIINRLHMQ